MVNALWVEGENLKDYDLQASNNNINYTTIRTGETVANGRYSFLTFTKHNAVPLLGWHFPNAGIRSELPCGRGVPDALALGPKHRREASAPLSTVYPTRGVVAYETYNQSLVQYKTEDAEKTILTFQWEYLDNDVADALESLWKGVPHAPELTVYPRPNAEPDKIYIAKWKPEFGFKFTGPFSALGKSGQAVFEEI